MDRILGQRQLEGQTKEIRVEDGYIELLSSSPQSTVERMLTSPSSSTLTSGLIAVDQTSCTFKKLQVLRDPVFSCQASPAPLFVVGVKLCIRYLNYRDLIPVTPLNNIGKCQ